MSSSDSKLHVYDSTNKVWLKAQSTASGILKCDTTLDTTGLATSALQTTGNASLGSLVSAISECNTGAVVVASGAITETNSATIAGNTASLVSVVTECNTGAVVVASGAITETNSATIAGNTASIVSAITECNTGAVVVASGNMTVTSGNITETSGAAIAGSTAAVNGKMSQGADAALTEAQQVVVYGRDSTGGLDALKVDGSGHLEVIIDEASNKGSHENLAADITLNSGAYSSVVNVADMNVGNLFYEDSSTASYDTLAIEVSVDGTNYFKYTDIYPADDGSGSIRITKETALQLQGLKNLRLINLSLVDNYTNVKATVVGSP